MVAAGMAALYLATLTANHTEADDAVSYAVGIREGNTDAAVLHAHHLLWGAIGWVGHNAALALGFGGGALEVLQVQNALTGAIGIGLLWWWLRSIGWPPLACVSACGVLGFSYAYWFYSSETEVYVLSAALLVCCLAAAHRAAREPALRNFALLGLANGLAVLAHDTNVLFAAVVAVVLLVSRRDAPVAELVRRGIAYAAVAVAVVVPAYTAAALVNGYDSPRKAYDWITGYTHSSEWGETRASQVPKGVAGASRSLVGGHFVFSNDTLADRLERLGGRNPREERFLMRDFPAGLGVVLLLLAAVVAAALSVAAFGAVRGRTRLDEGSRLLAIVCLAWAVVYGVFAVWWDPLNVEFWIVVWIPLALLISLPLAVGDRAVPRRARIAVAALVGGLFLVNLAGSILPQASEEDDYWRARIDWYEREGTRADLVVANGYHQTAYIAYFADIPVIDGTRIYSEGGADPAGLVGVVRGAAASFTGDRVLASRESFDPAGDPWSNCEAGDQCKVAAILRPALEPGSRIVHRDQLETVWQLARGR
jgi:hypothetical protein